MEIKELKHEQAENTVKNSGIPEEILKVSPYVVIILTQSWCSDWANLRGSLGELDNLDTATKDKLSLFVYEYDKSPIYKQFAQFKETTFQNEFIPFVLVYKDGALIAQGNFHHSKDIVKALKG